MTEGSNYYYLVRWADPSDPSNAVVLMEFYSAESARAVFPAPEVIPADDDPEGRVAAEVLTAEEVREFWPEAVKTWEQEWEEFSHPTS